MPSATATRRTEQPEEVPGDFRQPPQDLRAERSVIGSLLLASSVWDDICEIVRADDFYAEKHRFVFGGIAEMIAAGRNAIDVVTLGDWLVKQKLLEQVGGPAYLLELLESVPHAAHAKHYAEIVRDKARRRMLLNAATSMLTQGYDDSIETDDVFATAEQALQAASDSAAKSEGPTSIGELLVETLSVIASGKAPVELKTTGFEALDKRAGGYPRGGMTIFGARPSAGKTSIMLGSAVRNAEMGSRVLFWSYEQPKLDMSLRAICQYASMPYVRIAKGYSTPEERARIVDQASMMDKLPIWLHCDPEPINRVLTTVRRMVRKHKIDIVFIDYLQLVEPDDKRAPREQQVASMSRKFKTLAMQTGVAMVVASQLNRDVEKRENKRPGLADLRESGAIEQDADLVLMPWRPNWGSDKPEEFPDDHGMIVVSKNRNGETTNPKTDVRLNWHGPTMRYSDPVNQSDYDEYAHLLPWGEGSSL